MNPEMTVDALMRAAPRSVAVLKAFGIDTCCGARLPLVEAARVAGVELPELLTALRPFEQPAAPPAACELR